MGSRRLYATHQRSVPEGEQPDQLACEAADHEAFAQSRARIYIGRQEYYDRLDEHARGDGPPLVVLGESGSGKSALLANWAMKYRARLSQTPAPQKQSLWKRLTGSLGLTTPQQEKPVLLMHFIGATPCSGDWAAMVRRIMGEFKRRFGIEQEIPGQPDALRAAFANWLHLAAARGKVVLILDALNQLEDRDNAPDLVWLPPTIPSKIRLIVSAVPAGRWMISRNVAGRRCK
jgi:AAA ATPase domain